MEHSCKYSYTDHGYRNVSGDIGQKDKYTPSVTLNLNRGEESHHIQGHIYKDNEYIAR